MNTRKICVVVTARPSYSRIRTALKAIGERSDLELQLVVAASALLDRYGNVLRARPTMPEAVRWSTDQEKVVWQSMVDKDLAERPHWGDELKRRFSTEIDIYRGRK